MSNTNQPNSLEAEYCILACLIVFTDNEVKEDIFLQVNDDDFYYKNNKKIFTACRILWNKKKPIEIVTVMEMFLQKEQSELLSLITTVIANATPSTANYKTYISILKTNSDGRKLITLADAMKDKAQTDPYTARDLFLSKLSTVGEANNTELEHIETAAEEALSEIIDKQENPQAQKGLLLPWRNVNNTLGGLQKKEVTIIAARPGMGKSAFANEIILHIAVSQKSKVGLFNLEMSKGQIASRMYSNVLKKDGYQLQKATKQELTRARVEIGGTGIYVADNLFTIEQIMRACRVQKKRCGLDLVAVDYLQLVNSKEKFKSRREEVGHISRQLKLLAIELDIPIIALSQMNREVEKEDREPLLSDLREAGDLEQDASQVIFLHREKKKEAAFNYRPDTDRFLKISIAKNRNGSIGYGFMKFAADIMTFYEVGDNGRELATKQKVELIPIDDATMPF